MGAELLEEATTKRFVLHIRNPFGANTIYRATDTSPPTATSSKPTRPCSARAAAGSSTKFQQPVQALPIRSTGAVTSRTSDGEPRRSTLVSDVPEQGDDHDDAD